MQCFSFLCCQNFSIIKVKSCFKKPYDLVETAAAGGPKSQNLHPLKVMLSPEITAESDENELTTLNNQENFSENDEQIKNHVHKSDLEEPDQESEKNNLHSKLVAV